MTERIDDSVDDAAARRANSVDIWDALWSDEGEDSWRKEAMRRTYVRIQRLLGETDGEGPGARVTDIGGGVGFLAKRLNDRGYRTTVVDHSASALDICTKAEIDTQLLDLIENPTGWHCPEGGVVVATECIEHFSEEVRTAMLTKAQQLSSRSFFSVPNNRLGPDEEPQHTIKWTALEFKRYLESFWGKGHVRIEALGPYLLGVCTKEKKPFTLSVCFPARDEAEDIEACLASYMGVCDEMIIGIDPRSKDRSFEIAEQYADKVFLLEDPQGLTTDDPAPDGGVHFGHIRNQCAEKCTSDWIFMTEAHERLWSGEDTLLSLSILVPEKANVAFVFRNGGHKGRRERWAFPWLYRNNGCAVWKRNTHNVLDYADGTFCIRLPQVNTLHERHEDAELARHEQRKVQNRKTLLDDWTVNKNSNSLFYLAQEMRSLNKINGKEKAVDRYIQFLATENGNGEARYQSRLMLAKLYREKGDVKSSRKTLMVATEDDWTRSEHWVYLGDLAYEQGAFEQAYQFYIYASTRINKPPFTLWWIDLSFYSYIPAQRLAMICGELGDLTEALHWASRVVDLLPDDAHPALFEEAESNVKLIKDTLP
jgi:2-polyprenyl-3-methyl-5-hydroxy-6-metoxy-1,4-benzoquinol methylase/tetratricopeptide (TPR) repeat protein